MTHALSGLGGSLVGGLAAVGAFLFKAGGKEPEMRLDFQNSLSAAEKLVEDKIDAATKEGETKMDAFVTQFHESFSALRQKINDVELNTAKSFVPKADFEDFRREYREDRNRMFQKLDNLLNRH